MWIIILGFIIAALGALIVVKSEAVYKVFGPISFFEKYLGAEGGSRLGWKLIGLIVFFIGLLMFTGMIDGFMNWLLSPLINAGRSGF